MTTVAALLRDLSRVRPCLIGGALLLPALVGAAGAPQAPLPDRPDTLRAAPAVSGAEASGRDTPAIPADSSGAGVNAGAPSGAAFGADVVMDFDTAPPDLEPLRPLEGIRDPVFAILVGQALDRHFGRCDAQTLAAAIRGVGRPTKLPLQLLAGITRVPRGGDRVGVRAEFSRPLDLPVPYKILTYHPGSFRGAQVLEFEERDLGRMLVAHDDVVKNVRVHRTLELEDVRLYLLQAGSLAIDIDGWLDKLAGEKLDDTAVAGMVTFRLAGARYGMALGHNKKGEGRSGTIAFADDRLLYPNPPELKSVARQMRRTLEALAPELKPTPRRRK